MFEILIISLCIFSIIIFKIALNIDFKKIKNIDLLDSEELQNISKKFPEDKKICEDILKSIGNSNLKIKIEKEYNSCLYTIFNNSITIGKFKENYMKPQTIAHECIHANQSKKLLWFNFIFTNIYLIYFVITLILTFFNKLQSTNIFLIVFIFLSMLQYVVRFSLENEAMIKAKYVSEKYLKGILKDKETEKLLEEYERVNKIGIPFMNFYLISMNLVKIIIYAVICLI